MKTELEKQIAAHIKSLGTPEAVMEFYGVNQNQAKTMLRTKKATVAQAGIWMAKMQADRMKFTPDETASELVAGAPITALPSNRTASEEVAANGGTFGITPDDVVRKLQEMTGTMNEVIAFVNDLEARLNNTAELLEQLRVASAGMDEMRATVNGLVDFANGASAVSTTSVPTPPQPAGAAKVNGGGFLEPEVIGSVRPGRDAVPVIGAAPAAPAFAPLHRLGANASAPRAGVEPARRPVSSAVELDTGSIKQGTAFDYLRPHEKPAPR